MPSILLKNGKIIDVVKKTINKGDIYIEDGRIAGYPGRADKKINLRGAYVAPGLIEGHMHIESSMLSPIDFAFEAVRYGTTSLFVDPHEIANVMGRKGIDLFLDQSEVLPLRMNVGVSSCVPATAMETSGGEINEDDIRDLINDPRVFGLSEMMNFPGIVGGFGDARDKVNIAIEAGKIVDGHCPGLSGEDLLKYISNGESDWKVRIGSDHECTNTDEAVEKWTNGMYIMLRHGSAAKDLERILPGLCAQGIDLGMFGLVSDDLSAYDLRRRGHINHLVNIAARIIKKERKCSLKSAVLEALAMATINHARYFRKYNLGALERGMAADIIVFRSMKDINPHLVISGGKIVARKGKTLAKKPLYDYSEYGHPVKIAEDLVHKLIIPSSGERRKVRVITMEPGTLLTGEEEAELDAENGVITADAARGILKVAVIERHKGTQNVSVGFVKGFDMKKGAIASTIAHDAHNLVIVGADEASMLRAAGKIKDIGGGLAAVYKGREEALPLELGGIMSIRGIEDLLAKHKKLHGLLKKMGFKNDPFPMLSFIALEVIPKLKITDKGLVDVEKFAFVDLFC